MTSFFAEIDELADCLETFSHQDGVGAKIDYSFAMQQEIYEFERLSSLVCAKAVTETNLHCKEAVKQKNAMFQMQQPYYFEHLRTYKANKQHLQDAVKEKQLYDQVMFSEDLLIRSQRDSMSNIIPFLMEPNALTAEKGFRLNPMQTSEMLQIFRLNPKRISVRAIGETEAVEEDFAKEAKLEEFMRVQ
jgi:hypothetical protein